MDDGSPALEVGFTIDTSNAFDDLAQLQQAMNSTEAKIVAEAKSIEKATGSMVNLGAATAQFSTFGTAATRELRTAAREAQGVERAIERMISAIDRDTAAVGRTRDQQRAARAEELALAAARLGNADAADRLQASLRALSIAQSNLAEDKLAAEMRASADAAAERTRQEAALNAQLLERSRIEAAITAINGSDRPSAVQVGATFSALAERERMLELAEQQAAAERELIQIERQQNSVLAERARIQDALERTTGVGRPSALQSGASYSALSQMVRKEEELAAAVDRIRASLDPAAAAQRRFNEAIEVAQRAVNAGVLSLDEYVDYLRLQRQAMDELGRSAGGVNAAKFAMQNLGFQVQDFAVQVVGGTSALRAFAVQAPQAAGALTGFGGVLGRVGGFLSTGWGTAILLAITLGAGFADSLMKSSNAADTKRKAMEDLKQAVDNLYDSTMRQVKSEEAFQQAALDSARAALTKAAAARQDAQAQLDSQIATTRAAVASSRTGLTGLAEGGDFIAAQAVAQQTARQATLEALVKERTALEQRNREAMRAAEIVVVNGQVRASLDATEAARRRNRLRSDELADAYTKERITLSEYTQQKAELDRATEKEVEGLKKTKTHVDRHAQSLARATQAGEVQVENLYALAAAYDASGASALIAEAKLKAQSAAIRQGADISAATDRQIRASIAQQLVDAARQTAGMRDQIEAQREVNKLVADGLVPAERAAQLVQERQADIPLMNALAAAQLRDKDAVQAITDALERQRTARAELNAEQARAQFNADTANADDQIAMLREELRLVGASNEARAEGLSIVRAQQEAAGKPYGGADADSYIAKQREIAALQREIAEQTNSMNDALMFQADRWDLIAGNIQRAGRGLEEAFGAAGRSLGDFATVFAGYRADQERVTAAHNRELDLIGQMGEGQRRNAALERENARFALRTSTLQIGAYGDMAQAAKGFFGENTAGYQALATAEKAFRAVEFALSVRAMAQDASETVGAIARSGARAAAHGVEAVAKAIASLPFPLNLAAGAATAAAIASLGIAIGGSFGGGGQPAPSNTGTGTVLGDASAKSDSVKRAIDELKAVDTLTNVYSRQMLESLRSIDSQIGGVASVIVRGGDINASAGIATGYNNSTGKAAGGVAGAALGGVLLGPLGALAGGFIGKLLGGLFGTRTDVTGSGIYGGAQSLESILGGGFNGQAYSDITKTKKFLGIVSGRSNSTQYGALDPSLSNQFTLILRSFNDSIAAAAGPLGESTEEIQKRLNGFVVNIGKIDLKGLTGEQIQEKLTAVFGAAADGMANAALPGLEQFQKVGEGAFETLVRVASTAEQVTTSLDLLGTSTRNLGLSAKLGLADQFDSLSALKDAADGYFQAFYSQEEQAAAKTAQMAKVFASLGFAVPGTLASFRQLVEAQDLTTAAGQAAYATLLQLAPAFADLQQSMAGAKSAADVLSERQDLERQILELQGRTDELRRLDLSKLDASNRALQQQIYAIQDAQEAAKAADDLRQAWQSIGDTIEDEVKRIRGLTSPAAGGSFASLLGQFNAATIAARGGSQDAAKSLPQLSQALLAAAADAATSQQELARVQAQTARSLEDTLSVIGGGTGSSSDVLARAAVQVAATAPAASDSGGLMEEIRLLRQEVADMRQDNNRGHAATAGNTGAINRRFENITNQSGGDAISIIAAEPLPIKAAEPLPTVAA